jgi:hypothetical protein
MTTDGGFSLLIQPTAQAQMFPFVALWPLIGGHSKLGRPGLSTQEFPMFKAD